MSPPHSVAVRAAFFDRDGVLVRDAGRYAPALEPLPGAAEATARFRSAGWRVVVVTNQPAVARGDCTLADLARQHEALAAAFGASGGGIDAFYVCPHHPSATIPAWRAVCECRKPRPGLLLRAATDLDLDLRRSVMVGDRVTDIEAGWRAGCRTALVRSGAHAAPRIVTPDAPIDLTPDLVADDALAAASALLAWS